jgi:hypothetical protein
MPRSPKLFLPFGFSDWNFVRILTSRMRNPPWFDYRINIWRRVEIMKFLIMQFLPIFLLSPNIFPSRLLCSQTPSVCVIFLELVTKSRICTKYHVNLVLYNLICTFYILKIIPCLRMYKPAPRFLCQEFGNSNPCISRTRFYLCESKIFVTAFAALWLSLVAFTIIFQWCHGLPTSGNRLIIDGVGY